MSKTLTLLLLTSLLALGCEQDGSIGTDDVIAGFTRSADSSSPPTSGDAVVLWVVSSGSPDYAYIAGRGSLTPTGFEIELPTSMPAEAINSYGVGVGVVLALGDDTALADGRVPDSFGTSDPIGATPRHAIIYVDPRADGTLEWANEFPTGFSCGVGVEAEPGVTFDSFEPVSCDLIELQMGEVDTFDFVNWT